MSLELIIDRWFALGCLIFGLSHFLQPRKWVELYSLLAEKRDLVGLLVGTPTLLMGLFIITAHPVWTPGPALVVTIAGWMMTIKSIFYLLYPRAFTRVIPTPERFRMAFVAAGAVLFLLGIWLALYAFRN